MSYDSTSRRKVLKASIMAGVGGLFAGCSSEAEPQGTDTETTTKDNEGGSDTSTDEGSKAVEPVFDITHEQNFPPSNVNYTPLGSGVSNDYTDPTMNRFGANHFSPNADYIPLLVKKSELVDNNKVWRITLSDEDFTWHNGKPVKMQDRYYTEQYLHRYNKLTGGSTDFEEMRLVDDNTMEQVLPEPQHPGVFKTQFYPEILFPRWDMKEFYERMEDATTKSEAESINSDLAQKKKPLKDHVGHGMFQVEEVGDKVVSYTKYENHPYADKQNIEKFRVHFYGSKAAMRSAWTDDVVDMGRPPGGTKLPDTIKEDWRRVTVGEALMFNQFNEHLAKRGVRRAIAYVLDSESVVSNAGEGFTALNQTGMPSPIEKGWLSDYKGFTDKLIQYGPTGKTDKAAEEMKKAGYSKEGGKWVDSSGNPLKFRYNTLSYWSTKDRTIASQLRQFGIDVELKLLGEAKYYDTMETANSDIDNNWDILAYELGPGERENYPANCYKDVPFALKLKEEGRDRPHWAGRPWEVTVPKEIGQKEVSGSGQTLDLLKLQKEITSPDISTERVKELTETFAWYWNYDMPAVYRSEDQGGMAGDFKHFVFPDWNNDGSPQENDVNMTFGIQTGRIHGKTK